MPWPQRTASSKRASKTCHGGTEERRFNLLGGKQLIWFHFFPVVHPCQPLYAFWSVTFVGPEAALYGQSQECTYTYTCSLSIQQPLRCFDPSQSLHSSISKVITLLLAPILSFSSPLMLRHHPAAAPPTHAAQGHPQVSKPIF